MMDTVNDERPRVGERYSVAVAHGTQTEVIGAMGVAGKALVTATDGTTSPGSPLGAALHRLFVGDNGAASEIILLMAQMLCDRAAITDARPRIRYIEAKDLATVVLGWYRDNKCKRCNGLGMTVIPSTTTLKNICGRCNDGIVSFDRIVRVERVELARWLSGEIEREQGRAGALAMRALVGRLDL